jgi:predicted nucleotidyltransferase
MVDQASILTIVRERIVREFNPLKIILFGSRARGDARVDSDVDLLVVFSEVSNKREAAIKIRGALQDLPVGKDIIVTTPDEIAKRGNMIGSVLRPALQEGQVIFERN